MKRLSVKHKLRLKRLAILRFKERNRGKLRSYIPVNNRYISPNEVIKAPKNFNLLLNKGAPLVVKFIKTFSHAVLSLNRSVKLDFRETEAFHVPATILFFAELDRVISMSSLPKPITILDPRKRKSREVLKQIGVYRLTGDKCDITPTEKDVIYWQATSGATQSGDEIEMLDAITDRANQDHVKQVDKAGIWRGVSEAVANTVDHAYIEARKDGFSGLSDKKWWMFTQIRDGYFTAAVCDLGCGYSATIKHFLSEALWIQVSKFTGGNKDSYAIKTAMEYSRSGTREPNRGKGSKDALSVLETHKNGELVILSNTGAIRYKYQDGVKKMPEELGLGSNISGTIIWWKLPLKEGQI